MYATESQFHCNKDRRRGAKLVSDEIMIIKKGQHLGKG